MMSDHRVRFDVLHLGGKARTLHPGAAAVLAACIAFIFAVRLVVATTGVAEAAAQAPQAARDADQIRTLIAQYQQSLNLGSVEQVLNLYAPDGVVMPADIPAQNGAATI